MAIESTIPHHSTNAGEVAYAQIVIPLALPQVYTWMIPSEMALNAVVGKRVEVVLRNKKYAGIILSIFPDKPIAYTPKPILSVLDEKPMIDPIHLKFWKWISQYYLSSMGEIMQAAVPANLKLSSESILVWNEDFGLISADLSDDEFLVAEALEIKKELRISEVQQLLGAGQVYPIVKQLIDKKACFVWEELKERYKLKTITVVRLHPHYLVEKELESLINHSLKAPKQLELLLSFLHLMKTEGLVEQAALLKKSNASAAQLKGLIDKNILIAEKQSTDRIYSLPKNIVIDFTLSEAQQTAMDAVKASFENKHVCLLHGVTASGKTLLYIQLIEAQLKLGKQVLYMLPEIALTAQVIRRLEKHFGGHIAVYHSKLNSNERVELWYKVKTGAIGVILGARSALFLPFKDLGLLVVDEEHDPSYKQQEPAPRYYARDAAIYLAGLFGAKVLLGSATPSMETYFNCLQGKYGLVKLSERFGQVEMPQIEIVDVRQEMSEQKQKIAFSAKLVAAIAASLEEKKQVILFQNRRGYTPFIVCNTCGWIPQCSHCNVSLTYHKSKHKLTCHYCGTTYPLIKTCLACGSQDFVQKNFGTEKLEENLEALFPNAKIARMDYDSVKGKNAHDTLIKQFEDRKIDILVGTQMVVKGLDFEHVNLVGIIDGDGILHFTDFRVNERAFQLMEQVSGRAGRKDGKGKVLIQVSNIHHPVLGFLQAHDFEQLYQFELEGRSFYHYPPFYRLIKIIFKHKESKRAEDAAHKILEKLHPHFGAYISGPAQPVVDKVRNLYIWEILLKLPKDSKKIEQCKQAISQQIILLHEDKTFRSVVVLPDVDPV